MLLGIDGGCNDPALLDTACPICGRVGDFRRHGSYLRWSITMLGAPKAAEQTYERIDRVLCRGCRRTHSLLPMKIVPRSPYSKSFRQALGAARSAGRTPSVSELCAEFGIHPRTFYRLCPARGSPDALTCAHALPIQTGFPLGYLAVVRPEDQRKEAPQMKDETERAAGPVKKQPVRPPRGNHTTSPDPRKEGGAAESALVRERGMALEFGVDEAIGTLRSAWAKRHLSAVTIKVREWTLRKLVERAQATGATVVTEDLIMETAELVKSNSAERSHGSFLQPLREMRDICGLRCDGLTPSKTRGAAKRTKVPERFAEIQSEYLERERLRQISDGTFRRRECSSREFLAFVDPRVGSVEEISREDVSAFLALKSEACGAKAMSTQRCELRFFVEFLVERYDVSETVASDLAERSKRPPDTLQAFLSEDEVRRLVEAAARHEPNPKRALAFISILVQYAVRVQDIVQLTLGDIDWVRSEITFRYSKSGRPQAFGLTESVRYALIDYLMHERPKTDCPNVFTTVLYPIGPLLSGYPLTVILRAVAKEAGIDVRKGFGCHAIRRSSATALMNADVPYPDISRFLNHGQNGSALARITMKYIKVDIEKLRTVSLEVPSCKMKAK